MSSDLVMTWEYHLEKFCSFLNSIPKIERASYGSDLGSSFFGWPPFGLSSFGLSYFGFSAAASVAIVAKSRIISLCPDSSIIFATSFVRIAVVAVLTIGWNPTNSNSSMILLSTINSIFFSVSLTIEYRFTAPFYAANKSCATSNAAARKFPLPVFRCFSRSLV
jgi:hypothetical protein